MRGGGGYGHRNRDWGIAPVNSIHDHLSVAGIGINQKITGIATGNSLA
ncbi:hypothetical protein ASZ90_016618 [hydrocarbon metagenome]|uniref:Uncharacterized protein n=1 Tax=hydrocarbon metagenome TaxID=938273 RepID=A0A0W8EL76_9ZZZZ